MSVSHSLKETFTYSTKQPPKGGRWKFYISKTAGLGRRFFIGIGADSTQARDRSVRLRRDDSRSYRLHFLFTAFWAVSGLASPSEACLAETEHALTERYAPYADWSAVFDTERVCAAAPDVWWSTPDEIIKGRDPNESPLTGLHVALDPGHIGGIWAPFEGRNFRIDDEDFWVREGELVLEVAQRVRSALVEKGATVTLLRDGFEPINPKRPLDYWSEAERAIERPSPMTLDAQIDYALRVRDRAVRLGAVIGEIVERARMVNEEVRPDLLLSLHINAAPWPSGDTLQLVDSNHTHVLIFGCMSDGELRVPRQQARLVQKLANKSGAVEEVVGEALGRALIKHTELPPSEYSGRNAIRLEGRDPSLWARNLLLLRLVDCPAVLLEPYIANSHETYPRIQSALASRAAGEPLEADDILVEYADAVVEGVLRSYGTTTTSDL